MPAITNRIGQNLTQMPIEMLESIGLKAKADAKFNC